MSDLTAEEFVRNKIRQQRQIKGEMRALWTYKVSGEDALRWAHEFALLKANDAETSHDKALHKHFVSVQSPSKKCTCDRCTGFNTDSYYQEDIKCD
jgi:hypothetical protein